MASTVRFGNYEWDPTSQTYLQTAEGAGTHDPGFFHENADLSIITYDDGTWDAFDGEGFSVKASLVGVVTQSDLHDARQSDNGQHSCNCCTQLDMAY